ncbi:hypothetical protein AB9K32_07795 [Allomuricauda sp. XS_ASV26]|uniref:hypothetical protein n=1 Tax=Allomuricauda sp. XS_ASV26 TaxID=3241292 RepID=UPI0035149882
MADNENLPRNSSGLSGEYFVAAELYRRGFSVGLTIGNAKAIDILAEKNGKAFQIQVKTIRSKKSVGWPLMENQIKKNVIYILVNLNLEEQPDYYILFPDEIRKFHKQYNTRGIVTMAPVNRAGMFLNKWGKIS